MRRLRETETTLARVWCELLEIGQIGRHDNFFELGGHSLLAVRLSSQLRQQASPCRYRRSSTIRYWPSWPSG
ncbi:hypothetical protein J4732_19750 [Serratia marcescens]|uniref:Carrier domain-containing protein n=1 Tax=Serratia marcescens TaxID=615 RepID=A0A939SVI6_SERMA|nr:hypothetical protein [Serratia marcescens]